MTEECAKTTAVATIDRRWWMSLGFVAAVGATLRIIHAIAFVRHPFGAIAWIDEQAYWERALDILAVGAWPSQPFYQDPLYPYLLALIVKIVGPSLIATRVVLTLCGMFTPVFVGLAAREGFGKAEGLIAATFIALHGPLVFTDCLLEKEGLGALFAAIALWLSARAFAERSSLPFSLAGGAAWGLLALLRSNALLVGPLGVLIAIGSIKRDARNALKSAAAFGLGFLAPIIPAVAINASLTHPPELIVTTWQSGANFYIGNGPEATGVYSAPDFVFPHPFHEAEDYAGEAIRRAGRELSPNEVSRFWFRQGLLYWRDHPQESFRLFLKKLLLITNDYEVSDNHNYELTRLVLWPTLEVPASTFGVLFPAAMLGFGVRRSSRTRFWWLTTWSTGLGLLSTAVFFVVGRYRVPWLPGLAVLAGAGIVDLARRARERRWIGVAARLGLLVVPAILIARLNVPLPSDERWGHAENRLFAAELNAGQIDRAIDALDDGRALGSSPMQRFNGMISSGGEANDLRAAIAARLSIRERLGTTSEIESARLLRVLPEGRERSRRLLDALLKSRADDPNVWRESAAWRLGESQEIDKARAEAIAEFGRAIALGDGSAAIDLALLTRDRTVLERPGLDWSRVEPYRLRVARAILR